MGMSASQMRYCLIAGKKNDVEFQGQQINQQRTMLATQSSACNSQLLDLSVPTPPSSSDYTTTTYKFSMNGNTNTIKGIEYDQNAGKWTINSTYPAKVASMASSVQRYQETNGKYYTYASADNQTGGKELKTFTLTEGTGATDEEDQVILTDRHNLNLIDPTYLANYDSGTPNAYTYYKYTSGSDIRYVRSDELATTVPDNAMTPYYYVDEDADTEIPNKITNAVIEWSDTGRMETIKAAGQEFSLSVSTVKDDDAFNDAYEEYEYQKNVYDNNIQEINARMDIIQAQDKKLELKLQDLDTQQEALSTEMDSVKKVIDKNIEASFKAFA